MRSVQTWPAAGPPANSATCAPCRMPLIDSTVATSRARELASRSVRSKAYVGGWGGCDGWDAAAGAGARGPLEEGQQVSAASAAA